MKLLLIFLLEDNEMYASRWDPSVASWKRALKILRNYYSTCRATISNCHKQFISFKRASQKTVIFFGKYPASCRKKNFASNVSFPPTENNWVANECWWQQVARRYPTYNFRGYRTREDSREWSSRFVLIHAHQSGRAKIRFRGATVCSKCILMKQNVRVSLLIHSRQSPREVATQQKAAVRSTRGHRAL